ncbi:pentapeptide repeat-containing protein [Moorena sp. SIO3H5]|uniref:pentapeptide repeat-containing protein n=1 Tax=Moorena sp. SIO3H5 TaxID=2607834 RepID=UPI0013B889F2|nr:pentapeptide repeat-containing protein [Moorena sp. SIO3H5]NEO72927.1 pentapeptide repeat-containing protein [Moorena sp. SIO3H5]
MADKEHLAVLKRGIDAWNQWRRENPNLEPDLSEANLRGADLSRADLRRVNLIKADLNVTNLRGANLSEANLLEANLCLSNLIKANLNQANLCKAKLRSANLYKANLIEANLSGANLIETNLYKSDLCKAKLRSANLYKANLSRVNLSKTDLCGCYLGRANLSGANPSLAEFRNADLSQADLRGADLSWADLSKADLSLANLSKADLSGANFHKADLTKTDLSGADLSGTDLSEANLTKANLREAYLIRTQALDCNFTEVIFTGACLEDWKINQGTKLKHVICEYAYLKYDYTQDTFIERRPRNETQNFAPGEFTCLFQKALETVDLTFSDGIDWKAFLLSFQQLREEYGEEYLSIQAIEKKSSGSFLIRIEVPLDASKAEIERQAKTLYETKLSTLEGIYRAELKASHDQLASSRQRSANLWEIVKQQANRPII